MKGTERFKEVIKEYLDKRAAEDPLFAANYSNPKKNIEECVDYIIGEVKKSGRQGFADDEIYGMAVHYYDEAEIKVKKSDGVGVVVNHAIELTEEEKAEARRKAIEEYKQEEKRKIHWEKQERRGNEEAQKQKEKPAPVQTECDGQLDLFNMLSDEA